MVSLPGPDDIDALVFDAGGVLLLPDHVLGQEVIRALGCVAGQEDWVRAHYATNVVLDNMEPLDWPAVRRAFASALGVGPGQIEAAVPLIEEIAVSAPWAPVPGAADALRSLSDAGYKLGIVSNAFGTIASQLESGGICSLTTQALPRVEVIIDSYVVGVEKPDPRIFHMALEALGVVPSRALYVGDTVRFDVAGACAAGLHPVHVDPFGLCPGGHAHIRALGDLVEWLVASPRGGVLRPENLPRA